MVSQCGWTWVATANNWMGGAGSKRFLQELIPDSDLIEHAITLPTSFSTDHSSLMAVAEQCGKAASKWK